MPMCLEIILKTKCFFFLVNVICKLATCKHKAVEFAACQVQSYGQNKSGPER